MRKSLKLALIGAAILGSLAIAGCGDNSKPSGASSTQESKLMQTIKQRGKLIVGTSSGYPPYVFVDADSPDKKVIGLDIELCKQIADKLGVQMEVQDMGFSALLSSVTSGKVDIAVGGVNPTPEREKAMAFSDIYLPTEQKLLVLKKNEHLYKDMADLDGKTIGAEKSTTQETTAQSIKGANVIGLSSVQFQGAKKVSAVALPKGSDDVLKVINGIIKQDTESGQFDKWVDEYSKIAVEKAKK